MRVLNGVSTQEKQVNLTHCRRLINRDISDTPIRLDPPIENSGDDFYELETTESHSPYIRGESAYRVPETVAHIRKPTRTGGHPSLFIRVELLHSAALNFQPGLHALIHRRPVNNR